MEQVSKLGLALSGGGFTGYLFEIGALAALDDLFEDGFTINDFDLYIGVSAGSAAAALLANGVTPKELLEANLACERPYYFERRDIFVPAMREGVKTVLRAGRQLIPLLKLYYRNRREMSLIDVLDQAQDALPSGFYTLEPFARYLEETFAAKGLSNSFEGLRKELYIPVIDLETGQSVIFGEEGKRKVPISRAIAASSAAPIYFCPVRIDGRDYIDAGIGRLTFFEVAVRKGADFLLVVNPAAHIENDSAGTVNRIHSGYPGRIRDKGFLSIGEQASRINLAARFSQALTLFRGAHPQIEFFVISPKPTDSLLFERNFLSFGDRVHLLRCGYLAATQVIKEEFVHIQARFAQRGVSVSLEKFEERTKERIDHLESPAVTPPRTLAPREAPGGESSAVSAMPDGRTRPPSR